jgi:hypothetical protein
MDCFREAGLEAGVDALLTAGLDGVAIAKGVAVTEDRRDAVGTAPQTDGGGPEEVGSSIVSADSDASRAEASCSSAEIS